MAPGQLVQHLHAEVVARAVELLAGVAETEHQDVGRGAPARRPVDRSPNSAMGELLGAVAALGVGAFALGLGAFALLALALGPSSATAARVALRR